MEKIPINFKEQITKQPNEKYAVVVVGKADIDLSKFDLVSIDGIDNLFKGLLTGHEILVLEKSEKTVSIESDGDMFALINKTTI